LVLHLSTGPSLAFHWITNNDTCSLTLLEMKLRGIEKCDESFFFKIVSPIYKPTWCDDSGKQLIWVISILLWLVTVAKVVRKPGMVTGMFGDMMELVRGRSPKTTVQE
jgi:hypothetical protein